VRLERGPRQLRLRLTDADLDSVWKRGFREMELLKRATLAGTGACQGGVCLPYLRSFLLERGGRLQPAFTARPLNRHLTVRELAAGAHTTVTGRSPLHDEHLRLGARMDRAGGWWRPWTYGRQTDEYRSVRERVSLGDVSSLGKMAIAGPDAQAFLERIVPTRVATIRPGRCRYVLMLDERGYVLDDGMLCREDAEAGGDRFFFTSTSGGSGFFELWLRDWAEAFGFDVRILNQTASLAAINVTGSAAARLLARAGAPELPAFSRHRRLRVAGIDCRVVRLSFTGELSYELHHAAVDASRLWRRLLTLGGDLNVRPHGLETLLHLRLEKGHIVVGQDTDYDSTPRRLGHEWAVDLNKGDFIGRQAILRTNKQPPDRRLAAFRVIEPPPAESGASLEGAAIRDGDRYAGYVTSAASREAGGGAAAGTGIPMLGWLYLDDEGALPREVTVAGRPARRIDGPVYDPDGERARVAIDLASAPPEEVRDFPTERPEATDLAGEKSSGPPRLRPLEATRVVAAPAALDALTADAPWRGDALALRLAPDELLVTALPDFKVADDPYAIVERETGFSCIWLDATDAERFLDLECDWERPAARPALAQGEVAGIPVKLWFETERTLLLAPAPFAAAFQRRLSRALGHDYAGAV
jgi:glycine cleavage system aminomethyltransferase T